MMEDVQSIPGQRNHIFIQIWANPNRSIISNLQSRDTTVEVLLEMKVSESLLLLPQSS